MAGRRATLTLKLGDKEVRYEADREAVEAQLAHVLGRLLDGPTADVEVALAEPPSEAPAVASSEPAATPAPSEDRLLARLYRVDDEGRLRLRKLPGRTADALLLVLYGMLRLQDRRWVPAPGMTAAARASGARFDRADRLLAAYQDLIDGVGKRRGKRYRLTAAGREHCARLVESLVGPT